MRTHYSHEITPELAGKKVTVAGWVKEIRDLGSIKFVIVRDREGFVQVTVLKKKAPEEILKIVGELGKEYVIAVHGTVKETKEAPNGIEIIPEKIDVISTAHAPLPLDISGKIDSELDTRLTSRFMDLRRPDVEAIFMIRDCLLTGIRDFMDKAGFVEIHTPKIVSAGAEGGATLFPIKYFDTKAFLAQSPQLFKQTLMATGLDRVYEIGPAFRAEESATIRHLAEFTSFDAEMAFIKSPKDVQDMLEDIVISSMKHVDKHAKDYIEELKVQFEVPKKPFVRLTHDECTKMLGLKKWQDIGTEQEKKLGALVKKEHGHDFYYITDFPTELKKETFYAMRNDADRDYTGYFDLEYKGQELVSGGQREHRYDVLTKQMHDLKINPEAFEFYLRAFRYGMPTHGGFGLGIDRWVQKMLDLPNVREAVLFPRDRFRLVP
jgi:aspartyl-tRNA synthetase